ncbi:MAG: hypothetical protein Q8P60_16560 [Pseudorhodobacter sp.]|nr:hypothetical protein [Pseudorhodobacter sp.]
MAILYSGALPPGALVRPDPVPPATIWLTARAADLEFLPDDAGRVIGWRAQQATGIAAQAVAANLGGTVFHPPALRFATAQNGGLVLNGVIADANTLTFGLIFRAGPDAGRTLLALQPLAQGESLFLDAQGDDLRLAQKGGKAELTLHADGAGAQATLVLCALADGQAWLAVNGGQAVQRRFSLDMHGPADLFIGCRGPRSGLHNKLGSFALSDVLLWPGQNLLARADDPALHGAIALWHERARLGL